MNLNELITQAVTELPDSEYLLSSIADGDQIVIRASDLEHIVKSALISTVERIDVATVILNTNDPSTLYPLVRTELNSILTELNAVNA